MSEAKAQGDSVAPNVAPSTPPRRRLASTAAVICVATIFGLSYGLTAPLIASVMAAKGVTESLIGVNAAMYAVGVLLIASFLPLLTMKLGARWLMTLALLCCAGLLALFPLMPTIWLWYPLRIALGASSETLFVLSETWTNELTDDAIRGRTMAIYTAALSIGFAGGPAILSFVGANSTAFNVGAGIAALAVVPLLLPWVVAPKAPEPDSIKPLKYLSLVPIAVVTSLLNAAVEAAGLSFLALYATHLGWTEKEGLQLVSTLLIGAVLMQLPIGWLADRMNPRRLALILAVLSIIGAVIWPWTLAIKWLAYTNVFLWGGVFVGIYTVMLTLVGARFKGGDLVGVYALMSVAWGIGALVGPFIAGIALDVNAKYGFPFAVALGCAAFAVFMALRRSDT